MHAKNIINKLKYTLPAIFLQFCIVVSTYGQTISGTVISELSEPLAGVSICIPHTNIGTLTDHKGNYSIAIDSNYNTFSYCLVGFECKEVRVYSDSIVNITLEESPIELNKIVIKGIFVNKRSNIQGILIKRKGIFRKPDTIKTGIEDTTFNRLEAERTKKIRDSINMHNLNDSINFIGNISNIEKDFRKYIIDFVKYPKTAVNKGICGNLYVKFTINKENSITDIKILRGLEPVLDNEIISVLQKMPNQIQMDLGKLGKKHNRQIAKYIVEFKFELIDL
jgi:hypothetical protein